VRGNPDIPPFHSRIRSADIEDVDVHQDFYKLNALPPADVEFIQQICVGALHPSSRRVNENYLFMFSAWATIRKNLSDTRIICAPENFALDIGRSCCLVR
jgi:hypothetical protein